MPALTSLRAIQGAAGNAGGGAAEFYVGSFNPPASTGTQAITGVGFEPSAVIFSSADNEYDAGGPDGGLIGFSVNDATDDRSITFNQSNGRIATAAIVGREDATYEADMDSFDSDGFTLDWTATGGTGPTVYFVAIGGVNAAVLPFTTPGSTGTQALTGAGFTPTAAFGMLCASESESTTIDAANNHAAIFMGFADGTNQVSRGADIDLGTGSQNDADFFHGGEATAGKGHIATMDSFDSDGVTLDWTTVDAINTGLGAILVLDGVSAHTATFTSRTTTGTKATTGVGFEPGLVLFLGGGDEDADQENQIDMAEHHFGAAISSTSRFSVLLSTSGDQSSATEVITLDESVALNADFDSMDSDGFTLDWTTVDGTARRQNYLALAAE